jgi:hypothetical protein
MRTRIKAGSSWCGATSLQRIKASLVKLSRSQRKDIVLGNSRKWTTTIFMKIKVIIATVIIFSSGVLTGFMIGKHDRQLHVRHSSLLATNTAAPWQLKRSELLRRMRTELRLTETQHVRLEGLIRLSQKRTREICDRLRPQVHSEYNSLCCQIRLELTPSQQTRFDQLTGGQSKPRSLKEPTHLKEF